MNKFIPAMVLLQLLSIACNTQSRGSIGDAPFRAIHLAVGAHPDIVSIADVNHDGNLDILAANGGSANFSVYLGDGRGGFVPAAGSPFAAGPEPNDITTADFNGD